MDKSALVPLAEAFNYPKAEIGEQIKQLSTLQQKGIPVAQTTVILSSTLEEIANKSKLSKRLRKIIDSSPKGEDDRADLLHKLQHAVRDVELPQEVIKKILTWYEKNPGFVKIFTDSEEQNNVQENIIGDVNLIDSILDVWSKQIYLDFEQRQLKLFAQPILIQHQGEPQSSGVALTQSPAHKSQLQINSVWGVYDPNRLEIRPDEFEVDIRTKHITQRHLHPQHLMLLRSADRLKEKTIKHYLQDQFSLEEGQVLELAHIIITIKRLFLGDHVVNWSYQDGKFFVTHITPQLASTPTQLNGGKTLLTGKSLQPGVVSGTIFNLTHKNQLGQISHGQVVIVDQLTSEHLPALSKAAAIICNRGLAIPSLIRHLARHSLPTIINTRHATRYLRPGLSVIVNANTGQIVTINKNKATTHQASRPTITKTYISAGNPHKAQEYITDHVDGVGVLRSEYTFASIGEHPKHLLRSRKRHQLKTKLKQTIQAYRQTKKDLPLIYRTLDLTSNEFKALEFAGSFEPDEINPYLGFRGGIRTLNNFELLELELEVLKEIATENNVPLGLMLPFVRTPSELQLIKSYLNRKHDFKTGSKIGLYLQLNTPENILQLSHYLKSGLRGVSLNARSIHALLHGIDPDNPELFSLYPYDRELMKSILEKTAQAVKDRNSDPQNYDLPIQLLLHLEDNNLYLVEIATQLGFDVITVKPEFAPRVKQRIRELEEEKLRRS